jgi:hypothetical protein
MSATVELRLPVRDLPYGTRALVTVNDYWQGRCLILGVRPPDRRIVEIESRNLAEVIIAGLVTDGQYAVGPIMQRRPDPEQGSHVTEGLRLNFVALPAKAG